MQHHHYRLINRGDGEEQRRKVASHGGHHRKAHHRQGLSGFPRGPNDNLEISAAAAINCRNCGSKPDADERGAEEGAAAAATVVKDYMASGATAVNCGGRVCVSNQLELRADLVALPVTLEL